MELALDKEKLKLRLQSAAAVTLLSVSLTNDIMEISTNISSPKKLYSVLQSNNEYFGDGPYLVKYEPATDDDSNDIEYSRFAVAFTALTKLKRGRETGGFNHLAPALSEYNVVQKVSKESFGLLGHILIEIPNSPEEISALEGILKQHSLMYVFPDGTGEIHQGNLNFGSGIS